MVTEPPTTGQTAVSGIGALSVCSFRSTSTSPESSAKKCPSAAEAAMSIRERSHRMLARASAAKSSI